MDALYTFAWVMFAVAVTVRWWRICIPVALALLIGWEISKVVEDTVWLTYALLLAGLIGGVVWHLRAVHVIQTRRNASPQGVPGDNVL
jgi:F0F1-type ATP synthase assembly protein I